MLGRPYANVRAINCSKATKEASLPKVFLYFNPLLLIRQMNIAAEPSNYCHAYIL